MTRRVVAVIAARDEADRVGATIAAIRAIETVDDVVVADDGSTDGTAEVSRAAGALVVRRADSAGKGSALMAGIARAGTADLWLLADADLSGTAQELGPLLTAVADGRCDIAVAVLPTQSVRGLGLVRRAAASLIRLAGGPRTLAPLSGQRALSDAALRAVLPFARGFGVETAMGIDAARAGLRVVEMALPIEHRATGRTLRGFAHRGRQGLDIARAAIPRLVAPRRPRRPV